MTGLAVALQLAWVVSNRTIFALICQELTLVHQYDLDNRIEWYVDLMGAHAVGSTIGRSVVAIAELLRINFIILRGERGRRG